MTHYDYYSEIHNRLIKLRNSVRARPDRIEELLPLVNDVPWDEKEIFEWQIEVFLDRLRVHYGVWKRVLEESRRRKLPKIRRVK